MREKLGSGYANEIYLVNSPTQQVPYIEKNFLDTLLSIASLSTRRTREKIALQYYQPLGIAPKFLGGENPILKQEYIAGESLASKLEAGQNRTAILHKAGVLLRAIHQPVNRPAEYLKQSFEKKARYSVVASEKLLEALGLPGSGIFFAVDWSDVYKFGTVRIHGDFHLGNIIEGNDRLKIIDWEYARPASPFQEFALVELNIFYKYGIELRNIFWEGYGQRPDQKTIDEYVKLQCLRYLASISLEQFNQEAHDGFYHFQANIFRQLLGNYRSLKFVGITSL